MKLKRILASVLALCMVLSTMSFSVFADDETPTQGYMIYTYDEDGSQLDSVDGTKSASAFNLASALSDLYALIPFPLSTPSSIQIDVYEDSASTDEVEIKYDTIINTNDYTINNTYSVADGITLTIDGEEYVADTAPDGPTEVATYEELIAALAEDNANVIMMNDITATATQASSYGKAGIVLGAGDVLDGNGKTLTINGANSTWDCAIAMTGGEVKNLTIAGAMRGVFMPGANGDVVIDSCVFKDVIYTFNSDAGSKDYTVTIKNTTLNGWTSFSNVHKSVTFESCTFGEGSGYAFCRPYQATTFTNCTFTEGFELDTTATEDNNLAFNGCTYNGTALSAKNNAMFPDGGKVLIDSVSTDVTNYPPTGTVTPAYTSATTIWGEATGNASESFAIKLYSGDTLLVTATLNDPSKVIIDGNIENVTWNIPLNNAGTDSWWTVEWTNYITADTQPTKVVAVVDGVEVAENTYKLNSPDDLNKIYAAVADADGKFKAYYTDVQDAIVAAAPAGTVEILADVTVEEWVMIAESLTIGNDDLITCVLNGLTINGNNHTLTINSIESAGNGGRLFFDATELNIKNLTIKYADGLDGAIGLKAGTIENVTFEGCVYGVIPQSGDVVIQNCTFMTTGTSIYFEEERDGLTVTGCTFENADTVNVILLRGDVEFTNNTVVSGRTVNVVSGSPVVTGNNFNDVRFKVYNTATATIKNNKINVLAFNDESEVKSTFTSNTLSADAQAVLDAATAPAIPSVIEIYDWEDLKELDARVEGGDMLEGVTVKLMNDIDLYEMGEGGEPVTFNPIGANTAYFKGTFDGQGYTIKNMYQSGWALGYDWYNYGSIGLFAYIWNATIKNLTIENAECFVEGGSVAGIAGCAWGNCTFENITIKNSTYATYNNRAAGIVGYTGGEGTMTFKNVTVDEDTVIASLWGSYDSTLGGVVGSTQSSTLFHFEDVTVACKLDCYNDVTASYKWYSYRMCGMLIGRMTTLQTDAPTEVDPRGVVTIDNVKITIGEWANQTYIFDDSLSKGCQRVEPGYSYGGVDVSQYPDAEITELGFSTIIGGPQSQSKGYYGSDITKLEALEGFEEQVAELEVEDLALEIRSRVAQVGSEYFTSLQDAIDAVADGGTIVLLRDVPLSGQLINGWYEGLYYEGDKSFTVDLGDFKITNDSTVTDYLMLFKNSGSKANEITFKNGTIEAGSTAYCAICTSSGSTQQITVNLENINVIGNKSNGSVIKVRGGTVLNVKSGTKITGTDSYLGIEAFVATVNIYDGAEIYMNGTTSYNGCLVGVGGANSTVNVYGGYGEGASGGFIAMTSGGTINISGGEWIANTDGTYANSNKSVLIAQSANGAKSTINVTGGTFKGGYNCYGDAVGDAQIVIKGGNFNADPTAYVASGYEVVEADGAYTVVKSATPVAQIGEAENAQQFTSLQAAVDAAADGDVIVLLDNIDLTEADRVADAPHNVLLYVAGKDITLDMNGKTISVVHEDEFTNPGYIVSVICVADGAGLTVTGNGTINVNANDDNPDIAYIFFNQGSTGHLTIQNGTFHMDNSADSIVYSHKSKNTTVSGGTFSIEKIGTASNGFPCIFSVQGQNEGCIYVTGGTYNANVFDQYWRHEVQCGGEYAARDNDDGTWTVVPAVAYVTVKASDYDYRVGYETIDEAIAAAQDGESVTLIKDVPLAATVKVTKTITLDLNGKTITGTDNATGSFALIEIQPGTELIIKDTVGTGKITLVATNNRGWNAYSSVISNQRGKLTVEGGTIEHFGGTDMAYGIDNLTNTGAQIAETTINGGTIKSTYRAIRMFLNSTAAGVNNILTVNGGTLEGANKSIWMQNANANNNPGKLTVTDGAVLNGDVLISGNGIASEWSADVGIAVAALSKDSEVTLSNAPAYALVESDGVYGLDENTAYGKVAQIGETYFETLSAAIAAAQANDTIVLLDDVNENVTIDKNLTIDGSENNYTGTMTVNAQLNVTVQNVNFVKGCINDPGDAHGYLTIKNCDFDGVDKSIGYALTVRGGDKLTIENSTATNYSTGMLYVPSAVATISVKDVTVSNVAAAFNITYSGDGTFENVKFENVTYGIHFQIWGSRTYTVKNSDLSGATNPFWFWDKSNNTAKVTVEFEGDNIVPKFQEIAYTTSGILKLAADATLTAPEGITVTTDVKNSTVEYEDGTYVVVTGLTGSGTEEDPYLITNADELILFRDSVNAGNNYSGKYVKLVNNIDLAYANWTPIGDTTYNSKYVPVDANVVFSGVFDGNGKVISNLKISKTVGGVDEDANLGLFGITGQGAVIKNLTITNVDIDTDGRNVGALVGYTYGATLTNITVNGDIQIEGGNNVSAVGGMSRYSVVNATNIAVIGNDGSAIIGNNIVGGIFAEIAPDGHTHTFNNLSVENVAITGVGGVGGIVGLITLGTVDTVSVKNVVLTGRTDYQGNAMGRIRLGSVAGLMGSSYATIADATVENVTAKNLDGTAVVLPIIGANYDASSNATEAKIGDTYYATFALACAAAQAGETITLLVPVVVKAGETLTLDKAVTIEYTSNVPGEDMITNRGNLVIDGATLVYTNTDTTASNVTVSTISCEPGSVLEVKSGTVKNDSANNAANGIYAYAIDLLTNGSLGDVTATISGGEVISTNYMAIRQFNNGTDCKNTLKVTGGEIYGAKRAIQVHLKNDAAYLEISGGKVEAGEDGYALCLFPTDATHISVTGGEFVGTVYSGTEGFISGGTFDAEPEAAYAADGYEFVANDGGTYGVVKAADAAITAVGATLLYEDMIQICYRFQATGDNIAEYGMYIFASSEDAATHDVSKAIQTKILTKEFDGYYYGYTDGIAAKEMGDSQFMVGYIKLDNGQHVYSDTLEYSPKIYAERMVNKEGSAEYTKTLCKALMQYGAAAQEFFGYKVDSLMNAGFDAVAYDENVLGTPIFSVGTNGTNGFTIKAANLVFEGAITYLVVYGANNEICNKPLYLEYTVNGTTDYVELELIDGYFYGSVAGIAAKDMDEALTAKPYYLDDSGNKVYGVELVYSGYEYARRTIANSNIPTSVNLAKAFAMYVSAADTAISK